MPKKKLLIFALILSSVFLIAILCFIVFRGPKAEPTPATITPTPIPNEVAPSPALNWKKYENIEYRFSFQYPPDFNAEELSALVPNFLQVNLRKTQEAPAMIMVYGNYEPGDVTFSVGTESIEEKIIGEQAWHFFNFPQGYSRSRPFTVFQKEETGFLYLLKFYDLISDELRDQIMATVKFTSP